MTVLLTGAGRFVKTGSRVCSTKLFCKYQLKFFILPLLRKVRPIQDISVEILVSTANIIVTLSHSNLIISTKTRTIIKQINNCLPQATKTNAKDNESNFKDCHSSIS